MTFPVWLGLAFIALSASLGLYDPLRARKDASVQPRVIGPRLLLALIGAGVWAVLAFVVGISYRSFGFGIILILPAVLRMRARMGDPIMDASSIVGGLGIVWLGVRSSVLPHDPPMDAVSWIVLAAAVLGFLISAVRSSGKRGAETTE